MNNNQPIGVFDSGVGGLSILQDLKHLLPHENFVFLADQAHVPYGEKNKNQLIKLVFSITDYFVRNHNIKMIVVACNTATCNTIAELREKYYFPIVGTIPAVKPAALKTKSGTIAIISTTSTSKSRALKKLIKNNCQNINVLNIGSKDLGSKIETGETDSAEIRKLLLKYLEQVKNSNADYLVIGCTHYLFIKKAIQKIVSSRVKLIDSGRAIAKRTKSLLATDDMKKKRGRGQILYFTTGDSVKFSRVASKLLKKKIVAFKAIL